MLAPGIRIEEQEPPQGSGDALRADIAAFGGIAEKGPVLVPRRIEDWGQYRRTFGGFVPIPGSGRQALTPLAVYAFYQNGGGTSLMFRWASKGTRIARAMLRDPATDAPIAMTASSGGAWGNQIEVRIPLRITRRISIASFPTADPRLLEGDVVRFRSSGAPLQHGRMVRAPQGLYAWPHAIQNAGPWLVEIIDPTVDAIIDADGRRERHKNLSLRWENPRFVWRWFERHARAAEWTAEVPDAWRPLDEELALMIEQQGPGASELLRTVLPSGYPRSFPPESAPAPLDPPFIPPATDQLRNGSTLLWTSLHEGADGFSDLDSPVVLSSGRSLIVHPAPSLIALPDLMLPAAPSDETCPRGPFDDTREEPPPPPPPPCPVEEEPSAPPPPTGMPPPEPAPASELPGYGDSIEAIQEELIRMLMPSSELGIERGLDRTVLIDPFPGATPEQAIAHAARLRDRIGGFDLGSPLPHAALLYPWIRVLDPRQRGRITVLVPPSGSAVGIMARTTREGTPGSRFANITIAGAVATERELSERQRGDLNDAHLTAVHTIAGRGVLIFGARALSTFLRPDRFLPASRVVAYVRRVLRAIGSTLVFEPNDPDLWFRIRLTIDAVLDELWRKNALAGRTRDEAYQIRCDEVINPRSELDAGRVIAEIEIAPAAPTEFILIRIAFSRDGSAVLEDVVPARGKPWSSALGS